MFEKELIVLEEFDPMKRLEEYEFKTIPIWVRVFGLPLGMMDRFTGELVGSKLGTLRRWRWEMMIRRLENICASKSGSW
jgi:hypothetical protein